MLINASSFAARWSSIATRSDIFFVFYFFLKKAITIFCSYQFSSSCCDFIILKKMCFNTKYNYILFFKILITCSSILFTGTSVEIACNNIFIALFLFKKKQLFRKLQNHMHCIVFYWRERRARSAWRMRLNRTRRCRLSNRNRFCSLFRMNEWNEWLNELNDFTIDRVMLKVLLMNANQYDVRLFKKNKKIKKNYWNCFFLYM